jgi:hypothetical protein
LIDALGIRQSSTKSDNRTSSFVNASLVPLLACLYLPFIGGGYLTDDYAHVLRLSSIDSPVRLIDQPDTFGFYRPVTQASLALDLAMHSAQPALSRLLNVVLHGCVIALAFVVGRLLIGPSAGAALATLAFALTPKAHPIAVLWISARAELLMSAFSLIAVAAWILWTRNGRTRWLLGAAAAYALALLSKETATLLPLVLLLSPGAERPLASRVRAVAALCVIAVAVYAWRAHVGALTPFSGDEHYDLMTGIGRIVRSLQNYSGRMIAAPLALVVLFVVARFVEKRRAGLARPNATMGIMMNVLVFPMVWVLVFLAPVLPIVARSELYLYLPVFGFCLLAGLFAEIALWNVTGRRAFAIAAVLYIVALGGYQAWRAREIHRDLVFSEKLVAALRASPDLAGRQGGILLIPSDAQTESFLRDSIGGYLHLVLEHAFGSSTLTGAVQYPGEPMRPASLHLACTYRDGQISLRPLTSPEQ